MMSNTEISAPLKTSDNDDKSVTKPLKPTPKKSSKFGVIFLVITFLVGAAVGGYFLFNKNNDRKSSANLESNEPCILNIKDSHQPVLEITLAASHSEAVMSETQAREVEKAIVEAYNDASGGCSDDFKRWMYGINVLDQTVLKHAVLEEETESSISHTFDNEYSLVIRLETMISCDGCVDDEAFASVYPPVFGNRAAARHLIFSGDLSAGEIYKNIEINFETTVKKKIFKMNLVTMNSQHASYYEEAASGTTSFGSKIAALGAAKGSKGSAMSGAVDGAMAAAVGSKGMKAAGSRSDCGRAASKDGSKSGAKGGNRADGASKDGSKSGAKGGNRADRADGASKDGSKSGAKGGERVDRADGASKGGAKGGERGERADGTSKGGAKGGAKGGTRAAAVGIKGTKADRTRSDCDTRILTVQPTAVRPPPPTPAPVVFVYTPQPTDPPTSPPTPVPTPNPTPDPTPLPTPSPITRVEIATNPPTRFVYTPQPTDPPTHPPTPEPTPNPTPEPTPRPTPGPTMGLPESAEVTPEPTPLPTPNPTPLPTPNPTPDPTALPTPTPCNDDPCQLRFTDDTEASCDPKVQTIIEVDSWCGISWDPWCVVAYSDCFEVSECDATRIDQIANMERVDRTRIKCPENISEAIAVAPASRIEDPTCPDNFPGTGASCEATNLQCYYIYGDMEWVCNCGASPTEFYCKPKNE